MENRDKNPAPVSVIDNGLYLNDYISKIIDCHHKQFCDGNLVCTCSQALIARQADQVNPPRQPANQAGNQQQDRNYLDNVREKEVSFKKSQAGVL